MVGLWGGANKRVVYASALGLLGLVVLWLWFRDSPPQQARDFEECVEQVEAKRASDEVRKTLMTSCNAQFAARRKPGGGYTYFDFMQNRNFDIAGPNPTPEEQKKIDEEYVAYLERERRNTAAAALNAKHQEQQQQQASLQSNEKVPVPVASPAKQPARTAAEPPRTRSLSGSVGGCPRGTFSCDWPRLSDSINDIKKLFGATPNKGKKS